MTQQTNKKQDTFRVTITEWNNISKKTVALEKKAKAVRDGIHSLLVSVLKGFHDDQKRSQEAAILINAIMEASPYHKRAVSKWMTAILKDKDGKAVSLPFEFDDEKKAFYIHKDKKLMGKTFMAFRDTPFWVVSPAPEAQAFDFNAELAKLIVKAQAKLKKHNEKDVIDEAQLRAVAALAVKENPTK
jgi:hypothetical protein